MKDYTKQSDFEKLSHRVDKLEKRHKKWKPHWKHMQKDIDELKKQMNGKTECSTFDEEI